LDGWRLAVHGYDLSRAGRTKSSALARASALSRPVGCFMELSRMAMTAPGHRTNPLSREGARLEVVALSVASVRV
jgi:hypothetical protein